MYPVSNTFIMSLVTTVDCLEERRQSSPGSPFISARYYSYQALSSTMRSEKRRFMSHPIDCCADFRAPGFYIVVAMYIVIMTQMLNKREWSRCSGLRSWSTAFWGLWWIQRTGVYLWGNDTQGSLIWLSEFEWEERYSQPVPIDSYTFHFLFTCATWILYFVLWYVTDWLHVCEWSFFPPLYKNILSSSICSWFSSFLPPGEVIRIS